MDLSPHQERTDGTLSGAVLLCVFGLFLASFTVLSLLGWQENSVGRSRLRSLSGQVTLIDHPRGYRSSTGYMIELKDDNRTDYRRYRIAQTGDLSYTIPTLGTLRLGDQVTVQVDEGLLGGYALWEVRRGEEILLSYEQTRRFLKGEADVCMLFAVLSAVAACVSFGFGISLRRKNGTWH